MQSLLMASDDSAEDVRTCKAWKNVPTYIDSYLIAYLGKYSDHSNMSDLRVSMY